MEKKVHNTYTQKSSHKDNMYMKKAYKYQYKYTKKCKYTQYSSFYHLLYIPTFGYIVSVFFLDVFSINIFEILKVSIGWSSTCKPLTERMIDKSFDSYLHTFFMSISRSSSFNDCPHIPRILNKYSS